MQPQLARFGLLLWAILIFGCATTNVRKIDRATNPVTILCIEENPKVWVKEFLPFLETSFQSYGIKTIVYQETQFQAVVNTRFRIRLFKTGILPHTYTWLKSEFAEALKISRWEDTTSIGTKVDFWL